MGLVGEEVVVLGDVGDDAEAVRDLHGDQRHTDISKQTNPGELAGRLTII